jgi:hypothetical protein
MLNAADEHGERLVVSETEAYELLAHLVSSAELLTFEPHYYGTFRLLDAAGRLMGYMLEHDSNGSRAWLEAFKREVDAKKGWMMWDREGYFQFLREAAVAVAGEFKRRAAGASEPGWAGVRDDDGEAGGGDGPG